MADTAALLSRLSNAIANEANPAMKTMTRDEFLSYATEQVISISKDPPEIAKARIEALGKARETALAGFAKADTVKISVFVPPEVAAAAGTSTDKAKTEKGKTKPADRVAAAKGILEQAVADLADVLGVADTDKAGMPFGGGAAGGGGGAAATDEDDKDDEEEDDAAKSTGELPPVAAGFEEVKGDDAFTSNMNTTKIDEHGRLIRRKSAWGSGNSLFA